MTRAGRYPYDLIPVEWSPEAIDACIDHACHLWDACFQCDEASWPEAQRMAVRCVRLRVDRENRVVYPALGARAAPR